MPRGAEGHRESLGVCRTHVRHTAMPKLGGTSLFGPGRARAHNRGDAPALLHVHPLCSCRLGRDGRRRIMPESGRGQFDTPWLITACWGFGVTPASLPRHHRRLNPAVTLAMAMLLLRGEGALVRARAGARRSPPRYSCIRSTAPRSTRWSGRGHQRGTPDSVGTFSIFAHFPSRATSATSVGRPIDEVVGTALLVLHLRARRQLQPAAEVEPRAADRRLHRRRDRPPCSAPTPATPSTSRVTSARAS